MQLAITQLTISERRSFVYPLFLFAIPFAIPFGSLYPLRVGGANLTVADALVFLLFALWFARGVVERRVMIPRLSLAFPFALFFGAALVSVLGAESFEEFAVETIKWIELFIVYALVASQVDERTARYLFVAVFLAGSAQALVGIYQYYFGIGPEGFILPGGTNIRAFGTFEQPNPFAGYLALIAPVALGSWLTIFHPRALSPFSRLSAFFSFFALSALFALSSALLGIWASFSRGAWLAVAAGLVVTVVLASRRAAILFVLGALVVAFTALFGEMNLIPDIVTDRLAGVTDYFGIFDVRGVKVNDANFALVERMAHWQAAWEMFEDHPWLGVGLGNYAAAYPAYALPYWDDPLGHAHNYFLNVLAETGAIGASTYVLFWASAGILAFRSVFKAHLYKSVAAGLCGTLVALTIHNLFDNLFVHSMQMQVGITLGLLEMLPYRRQRDRIP